MILFLIRTFFPNYYRSIWNQAFKDGMEKHRLELHAEFPGHEDLVNNRVDEAIARNLK